MDGRLVSDLPPGESGGESNSAPAQTYTDIFYQFFPFYLSIGMSADEYWNQDCCLTEYYRAAHEIRQTRKNEELWLQGLYIYEALCDASPLLHAFAKRGTRPVPYPTEPYPRNQKEIAEREERDRRLRYEKKRADFLAMAARAKQKKKNDD